ncbi:MAG: GGDEF domain-containing protein [Campylobacterota bacterium]|nr:GGDEF domain-containing protein [Campylobacterota bacterium]
MIKLLKKSCEDKFVLKSLEKIYILCDKFQYISNINEVSVLLYEWLKKEYEISNIRFCLYDMKTEIKTSILEDGISCFLDGELSFYFVINTHTSINAIVSFSADDKEHYNNINRYYDHLEALFFQISPVLQSVIIKKSYVESSSIDSVTNVYNRQYLIEHITKIISLSKKEDETISFLMVGIDHFKAVTDEFDYDIGDKVLIELAKVIHSNIDSFDIVARLSGDEFLVALVNKDDNTISDMAKKIVDEFANTKIVIDDETQTILQKTVCIGISTYPKDNKDINIVLKDADISLYNAKNKGRSKVVVYTKDEDSSIDLF